MFWNKYRWSIVLALFLSVGLLGAGIGLAKKPAAKEEKAAAGEGEGGTAAGRRGEIAIVTD